MGEEKEKNIYGNSCDAGVFHYTVKIKYHFHNAMMPQSRNYFTRNSQAWLARLQQAERTFIWVVPDTMSLHEEKTFSLF